MTGRRQRVILRNGYSSWKPVISGVPQGSILGPVLFLIFVNDLPASVESTAKLFADDTKLYRLISSYDDCEILQKDLNILSAWSRIWLLKFNAVKCVVLKLREALTYIYTMNGHELKQVTEQRDLGVIVSEDLHPRKHIMQITLKANQRIGIIRRCFSNITQRKISILYTTTVRPLLEYASVVWSPWFKSDIDLLEKVQRRCLALCDDPPDMESLESRRKFTDLVETYKFLQNEYHTNPQTLFSAPPIRTLRGHEYKLHKGSVKTDIKKFFFTSRVITPWNNLSQDIVAAPSGSSFKHRLRAAPK